MIRDKITKKRKRKESSPRPTSTSLCLCKAGLEKNAQEEKRAELAGASMWRLSVGMSNEQFIRNLARTYHRTVRPVRWVAMMIVVYLHIVR